MGPVPALIHLGPGPGLDFLFDPAFYSTCCAVWVAVQGCLSIRCGMRLICPVWDAAPATTPSACKSVRQHRHIFAV